MQNSIQIRPDVSYQIASTGNYAAISLDLDTRVIPLCVYDCATAAQCSNGNQTQDNSSKNLMPYLLQNIPKESLSFNTKCACTTVLQAANFEIFTLFMAVISFGKQILLSDSYLKVWQQPGAYILRNLTA